MISGHILLLSFFAFLICRAHTRHGQRVHASQQEVSQPDIFIIGVQKAGTTSLHDLMTSNPQICSKGEKEKHFFSDDAQWAKGMTFYKHLFAGCSTTEKTVDSNLGSLPNVIERINSSYSPALLRAKKFILILREPVSRDFSWYGHRVRACLHAHK